MTAPEKSLPLFILALTLLLLPAPVRAAGTAEAGLELMHQGRCREALVLLEKARQVSPLDPALRGAEAACRLDLGRQQLERGDLAEARRSFEAGAELAPDDGRFPLMLGHVQLRLGRTAEAEYHLLEALRLAGPSPPVFRLLAQVCYDGGRLWEAESYLEQALEGGGEEAGTKEFLRKVRRELRIESGMENRQGGNFSISFVEGGEQLGGEALATLQEAYAELGSLFNAYPGQEVAVILYGNRDFAEVTGAPEWAGGAYDGKIRMPVGGLTGMNGNLRRALYHEYAHVLIRSLTRGNLPLWLNEGLAQVAEGDGPASRLAHLRHGEREVRLLPFARLQGSLKGLAGEEATVAYAQCHDFVRHLLDQYGWPRMLDLLEALGRGESFNSAAARLLLYPGETLDQVKSEWLARQGGHGPIPSDS